MRKKTQYIVVNEIYKTIYCGYPQKRAWKNLTTAEGGALRMLESSASFQKRKVKIATKYQETPFDEKTAEGFEMLCKGGEDYGFEMPAVYFTGDCG